MPAPSGDPNVTTRGRNRAAVLDVVLRSTGTTRAEISQITGLHAATVSRVVDELIQDRFVDEGKQLQRRGRGRRSTYIEPGPATGCVIGVDLGLATCRMVCTDLRGLPLAQQGYPSPQGLDVAGLVEWLTTGVFDLLAAANTDRPLSGVVVAVPASVRDGRRIVRPAGDLAHLAGTEFHRTLHESLGVPVQLDGDSNVALKGEMHQGAAVDARSAVLFTVSTDVGASLVVDGTILRGRLDTVGEFGSMPMGTGDRPLRSVLSVNGILASATERGVVLPSIEDLLDAPSRTEFAPLRQDFADGLVLAVSAVALSVEPEVVVFNGRMLPLVEHCLPELLTRLGAVLPAVPRMRLTTTGGYSGATGAAYVAAEQARAALAEKARAERPRVAG